MYILGINAYHADASAALICDGKLVAAAEEERFNRIKHCAGFPYQAVKYCLDVAGIKPQELTHIAVARDTRANLDKKFLYALKIPQMALRRLAPQGKFAGIKEDVARALDVDPAVLTAEVNRVEHHKAHLASSFFVSGFEDAALLSVDGLGDFASTMWGVGRGTQMTIDGSIAFPHSLGFFYTAITQYLGFPRYGDEFKVMGLASYGQPEFQEEFAKIVLLEERNGSRAARRLHLSQSAVSKALGRFEDLEREPVVPPVLTGESGEQIAQPRRADDAEAATGAGSPDHVDPEGEEVDAVVGVEVADDDGVDGMGIDVPLQGVESAGTEVKDDAGLARADEI